ncbi:MAG: hypothetical protein IKO05_06810 [Selenomonadaceae bacterium]|nr:hypothetical protein [Selenomonadaceae bacterium]
MAFFLIVPSVMIVSVLLVRALANRLGLRIYHTTLAAVAIMAFPVTFGATRLSPAIGREYFLWLGALIVAASGLLTLANKFLHGKEIEEERRFTEEVKAAYEAEKRKSIAVIEDKLTDAPAPKTLAYNEIFADENISVQTDEQIADENISAQTDEQTADENISAQTDEQTAAENISAVTDEQPADENISAVTDEQNADENISAEADEQNADEKVSAVIDEQNADEKVSAETDEQIADKNISAVIDEQNADEKVSAETDEQSADENISAVTDEQNADENISAVIDEQSADKNISAQTDEQTAAENISAETELDEEVKAAVAAELSEEPALPENFPLEKIFKPLTEPYPEEAVDEPIKLPEKPKPVKIFPLEKVFEPLTELKHEEIIPPPAKKSNPEPKFPLQKVFEPLSTLNLDKLEEITREEKNLPHEVETKPEEKIDTLDDLLDKAYDERDKGHTWQAIETYKKALERYQGDEYAPFVAIDLCNIYKEQALYTEAIKVYEQALALPALKRNDSARKEFQTNLRYLRLLREILLKHRALSTPFSRLPKDILQEVDIEFKKVQYQ